MEATNNRDTVRMDFPIRTTTCWSVKIRTWGWLLRQRGCYLFCPLDGSQPSHCFHCAKWFDVSKSFAASDSIECRLGFDKQTKQWGDTGGKKEPCAVAFKLFSFRWVTISESTFPARMRFENVQLAACNSSVGFELASARSPVGGVAIDVAEITHVSQVYLGSRHDEWRGKLLWAGTKVGPNRKQPLGNMLILLVYVWEDRNLRRFDDVCSSQNQTLSLTSSFSG